LVSDVIKVKGFKKDQQPIGDANHPRAVRLDVDVRSPKLALSTQKADVSKTRSPAEYARRSDPFANGQIDGLVNIPPCHDGSAGFGLVITNVEFGSVTAVHGPSGEDEVWRPVQWGLSQLPFVTSADGVADGGGGGGGSGGGDDGGAGLRGGMHMK
jgi:hypothetical protein